jgi:hypothetical protein
VSRQRSRRRLTISIAPPPLFDCHLVLDAVASLGFRPVDAGSLAAARTLEGMAWLNISRNLAGGTWQDAWIIVGPGAVQTSRN